MCDALGLFDCHDDTRVLCIPKSWVCDKEQDCLSGKDEEKCGKFIITIKMEVSVLLSLLIL